jgi:hypothetical protein
MKPQSNVALKEWASVVSALHRGSQLVLLRKGGLAEKKKGFSIQEWEFWLYPTYTHQEEQYVRPEHRQLWESPPSEDELGIVSLHTYAVVEQAIELRDPTPLQTLEVFHIWTPDFLQLRLDYKPESPLWVLLLRTYRLPHPVELPETRKYRGCRSWVTLEREVSTSGAEPVLSQEEFSRRSQAITTTLGALTAINAS